MELRISLGRRAPIIFLGAFYTVLAGGGRPPCSTPLCARRRDLRAKARRKRSAGTRIFTICPRADRACRHVLTGEFKSRECPHAFDCRECETHAKLIADIRRRSRRPEPTAEIFGMSFPLDRLYHRGHTWARPEADGTVTVGLDDLGAPPARHARRGGSARSPARASRSTAPRSASASAKPTSACSRRWMAKSSRPAAPDAASTCA